MNLLLYIEGVRTLNKETKKSYERLKLCGQDKYMEAVRLCDFRKDGKCGCTELCEMCPHKQLVQALYNKFCHTPIDFNCVLTRSVGPIAAGCPADRCKEYLNKFDLELGGRRHG